MSSRMRPGFTLYELLVTVLVASAILALGMPNLLEFTRNNRVAAAANDLITSIRLARDTAADLRTPVTLCWSPEPLRENPACDADGFEADSHGGYIVWTDRNADAVVDAGEEILVQRGDPKEVTVLVDNGYVHFAANGAVADIAGQGRPATTVLFCGPRGNVLLSSGRSAARAVLIAPAEQPTLLTEVGEILRLDLHCP